MATLTSASTGAMSPDNGKINEVDRKGAVSTIDHNKHSQRGFDPIQHRSHLYHAIEGMHRYPNYLQRWQSDSEIDDLEEALTLQLDQVRSQRQLLRQRREDIAKVAHHAIAFSPPSTWDDVEPIFDKTLARHILPLCRKYSLSDVLQGRVDLHYDVPSLTKLMTEETIPEVFGLPILDHAFCRKIQDHVASIWDQHDSSMSIMNLDWLELGWLNDLIFHVVMRPIARHLYSGMELDWRHGYLARYQPILRSRLVQHKDDSAVTLNIGINENYDGGTVRFGKFRGASGAGKIDEDGETNDYHHELGKGILHSGRHFHAVTPVTLGERWVWIIWTRSWANERSVTCPCCWLNNRSSKDSPCICGSAWN